MLRDINKIQINFVNHDSAEHRPEVLPARIQTVVNGAAGGLSWDGSKYSTTQLGGSASLSSLIVKPDA